MVASDFPYTWWSGPIRNDLYSLRILGNPLITIYKIKESNAIKRTFFCIFMLIIPTKKYGKPKVSHMST